MLKKPQWKTFATILGGIFLLYLCIHYWQNAAQLIRLLLSASKPLVLGGAMAYILNLLMGFYERHTFGRGSKSALVTTGRRALCLVASILTLLAVLTLLIWLIIPELVECIKLLVAEIPALLQRMLDDEHLLHFLPDGIEQRLHGVDWESYLNQLVDYVSTRVGATISTLASAVTSVVSATVTVFLGLIFALYLLLARDKLKAQCIRAARVYLPQKVRTSLLYGLGVLDDCFHRYIVGQCLEAVIIGVLCTLGMLLFRFPYAAMIGTLVGFTALIPVAGAYIGAGIGAIMILTVSPLQALLFLIFLVILQQLEGNLIYPKVVGNSVGLPGIWVLAAITVGGGLGGVLGMFLSVPFAAAAYRIIREDVQRREALAVADAAEDEPISAE